MKYSGTNWYHVCTEITGPQITEILSEIWKINNSLNITYKGLLNIFALKYQLCIISEWVLNEKVRRMDAIRSCRNLELFFWASSCSGLSILRYLTQWSQLQISGVSEKEKARCEMNLELSLHSAVEGIQIVWTESSFLRKCYSKWRHAQNQGKTVAKMKK